MSKGNMLLGHARGKVGDIVFSRSNGQQIVRSRAAVVKNPQTQAQLIQRTILNTVAQAYSLMQPITDHSFEGINVGQDSMSYFMRRNMAMMRQKLVGQSSLYLIGSFTPIGQNYLSLNAYEISKGSLPSLNAYVDYDEEESTLLTMFALSANTYQSFISDYGLQRGDQITLINIHRTAANSYTFDYTRVILDPRNLDGTPADMSTPFIVDNAVNLPSPKNEGVLTVLQYADGLVTLDNGNPDYTYAAAIIVSRQKSDGTWARSNATLLVDMVNRAGEDLTIGEALDQYQSGSVGTENPRYLNNSGVASAPSSNNEVGINIQSILNYVSNEPIAYSFVNKVLTLPNAPAYNTNIAITGASALVPANAEKVALQLVEDTGGAKNLAVQQNGNIVSGNIEGTPGTYSVQLVYWLNSEPTSLVIVGPVDLTVIIE